MLPHPPPHPSQVAGGIAAGDSPLETVVKECNEEASIPPAIATMATPVGTIRYYYKWRDYSYCTIIITVDACCTDNLCSISKLKNVI